MDELLGLPPGIDVVDACEVCGGLRVVVQGELLVDGQAGLLLDAVEGEGYAEGWADGWEFRRWLEAEGVDPDSIEAVDLVVATMSETLAAVLDRDGQAQREGSAA